MFNRSPATRPWTPPDDVFAIFRRNWTRAHAAGGLFQLVLHPFVIGYRSRIWILEALIEHAKAWATSGSLPTPMSPTGYGASGRNAERAHLVGPP
jgi:hypothetical protein